MTPNQIDLAIAEWRGWTEFRADEVDGRHYAKRPPGQGDKYPIAMVPQFHRCLNAMAEVEDFIDSTGDINNPDHLRYAYIRCLYNVVPLKSQPARAKAIQRAEALLRTIGKYQEPDKLQTHVAV